MVPISSAYIHDFVSLGLANYGPSSRAGNTIEPGEELCLNSFSYSSNS